MPRPDRFACSPRGRRERTRASPADTELPARLVELRLEDALFGIIVHDVGMRAIRRLDQLPSVAFDVAEELGELVELGRGFGEGSRAVPHRRETERLDAFVELAFVERAGEVRRLGWREDARMAVVMHHQRTSAPACACEQPGR